MLTKESFACYGDVVEPLVSNKGQLANQGTARRSNYLTKFINLRDKNNYGLDFSSNVVEGDLKNRKIPKSDIDARLNVCIFNCIPPTSLKWVGTKLQFQMPCKLLERHKYSTQLFSPMAASFNNTQTINDFYLNDSYYLVIVCLNDGNDESDSPNLNTLKAFIATSKQAINYHPGIWHHPIITLNNTMSFLCTVYERNEFQLNQDEDTEEITFTKIPNILGNLNDIILFKNQSKL